MNGHDLEIRRLAAGIGRGRLAIALDLAPWTIWHTERHVRTVTDAKAERWIAAIDRLEEEAGLKPFHDLPSSITRPPDPERPQEAIAETPEVCGRCGKTNCTRHQP